ncbi:hypothetical protein Tco_0053909 [Tanacetum coccineum]
MKEVIKAYRPSFTNLINLADMLTEANVPGLMNTLEAIRNTLNAQMDHLSTRTESSRSMAWNVGFRLTKIENTQTVIQIDLALLETDIAHIKNCWGRENPAHIISNSPFSPSLDKSTKKAYCGRKGNSLSTWGEVDMAQPEEPKEAKFPKQEPQVIQTVIPITTPITTEVITPITTIIPTEVTPVSEASGSLPITLKAGKEKALLNSLTLFLQKAELSKPEIMKVVVEMVNEAEVQISRRKEFLKHQESHLHVLSKAHNEKLKKKAELKNKSYDNYVWTITSRKKPEKINEIYIHLRTRPITITVYRNNDPRNFKVLKNFKFSDFSLIEWDELNAINPKKSK